VNRAESLKTLRVLLAREAGYIITATACQRLKLPATRLLALRRQALLDALGVLKLSDLATGLRGKRPDATTPLM
jgi:hypothetical protein